MTIMPLPLLKRIAAEKRAIVLPLALALVANILAYAFVVYPLGVKSAGAADRAAAAASQRQAAERDEAMARALVTGKARADEELNAFYEKVLPADMAAARLKVFPTLPALAQQHAVKWQESRFTEDEKDQKDEGVRSGRLAHLVIRAVLQGDYKNIRAYLYDLESSNVFVIIDGVTLLEGTNNEPQTVTLDLSTYYRQRVNGF
jgi:hypothetical protein